MLGPLTLRFQANLAALLAGQTDLVPSPAVQGINQGQGNQGSSNTAHTVGQAGTAADRFSLPRQMHFGGGGSGIARP